MPFSQIDDVLYFDDRVVKASGPLFRPQDLENIDPDHQKNVKQAIPNEHFKSFTVRVCQTDHHHMTGASQNLAEATATEADLPAVVQGDGTWSMELEILQGTFMHGMDGTATAVLVYEAGGDLFTLAWSECVLLKEQGAGDCAPRA